MSILKNLNEALKEARSLTEEEGYGLNEEDFGKVKVAIDTYLEKHKYLFDENRCFEVYVDYNDTLDKSTIRKIFDSAKPLDAFYDIIGDWDWWETADYEYDEIFKDLDLDADFKEENEDAIREYLRDYIGYTIPYDHFDETIGLDVYLNDPEGANIDYSAKNIQYEETENEDEEGAAIGVCSSIAKLLELQGHSVEEFLAYINEKKEGNKFFDSLKEEAEDSTYYDGNQVVILCQAPITEIAKAIQEHGTITIPAKAMCGLENTNGSGSNLDINLEKDITGTVNNDSHNEGTFEVFYKDGYDYSVDAVHGLIAKCWYTDVKFGE